MLAPPTQSLQALKDLCQALRPQINTAASGVLCRLRPFHPAQEIHAPGGGLPSPPRGFPSSSFARLGS